MKIVSVIAVLTVLGQAAFLMLSNALPLFLKTSAQTSPTVTISLKIGDMPVTNGMAIAGTEYAHASVSPTLIVPSGSPSLILSGVSFYFDNPATALVDAGPFSGTQSATDTSLYYVNLSGYSASVLPSGNYVFYAKAFYGTNHESEYESTHYTVTVNRTADVTASSPSPTSVAITLGITDAGSLTGLTGTKTLKATSSLPLSSLTFSLYVPGSASQLGSLSASSTDGTYKIWSASFDTTKFSDGDYNIVAKGLYGDVIYENTTAFSVNISNTTAPVTTSSATATPTPNTTVMPSPSPSFAATSTPITSDLTVSFIEIPPSPLSGSKYIYVQTDQVADSVNFKVVNSSGSYKEYTGILASYNNHYYFIWETAAFGNGTYTVKAIARKGAAEAYAAYNFKVSNDIVFTSTATPAPTIFSAEDNLMVVFTEIPYHPLSESTGIYAKTNYEPESLIFKVEGPKYFEPKVIKDSPNLYHFLLAANEIPDGDYVIRVIAKKSSNTAEGKMSLTIIKMYQPGMSPVASASANVSPTNFPQVAGEMPVECKEKNLLTPEQCTEYMTQLLMPEDCRLEGAKTQEECSKILLLKSLPQECRDANAASEEDCNKVMFIKYSPKECSEAGIYDQAKCETYLFQKNAPQECLTRKISNPDECDKYMVEKYGSLENAKITDFPIDCQKAGATSADKCESIMQEKYLPPDCKEQGITDGKQCDFYLRTKNMPLDCQNAGAKSAAECDKVMFDKFAPKECKKAGINDGKECENYMFNLYAPKTVCEGINDWDCKNKIREDHLGNIVAKQTDFAKVKEGIKPLAGGAFKAKDLKEKVKETDKMIPVKDANTVLKVVATEDKMVLNSSNNLVQTAPVAVMVDSDSDGLPDDMEKRLGTDPAKADTDGDGFTDGEEVRGGYNPLGAGKLEKEISPIDEAILNNKTLSHPKTDGEEEDSYSVAGVTNPEGDAGDDSASKYVFSGKAEPDEVVTLYVYSDLPLVVTVKTDENGNWEYELSKSLIDGEHEVYVALNDNTGKVVNKSKPINFFVKEARAMSVKDFVSSEVDSDVQKSDEVMSYYPIIAVLIIIIGILVFALFVIQKRKQTPNQEI